MHILLLLLLYAYICVLIGFQSEMPLILAVVGRVGCGAGLSLALDAPFACEVTPNEGDEAVLALPSGISKEFQRLAVLLDEFCGLFCHFL